jgi:hypothetical protein
MAQTAQFFGYLRGFTKAKDPPLQPAFSDKRLIGKNSWCSDDKDRSHLVRVGVILLIP